MCGIAGFVNFGGGLKEKENVLKSMADSLARRGPDDSGLYLAEKAALAHRRLAVIDPENGKQPMYYKDENTKHIIVYNGELYNTDEIRNELILRGFGFDGRCDTEVLLKAYVCFGEKCVEKFNGIFAFAIWEEREEKLFLARDRAGVKPLFYYDNGKEFVFASEIKALLLHPSVERKIDGNGIKELLFLGPGRTPGCGVISGVKELLPGECMTLDKSGAHRYKYWELRAKPHTDSLETTIERTRFLVKDAIERQLVSDVPLCCFLSGGLDSSIISKIASDKYREKGEILSTYSVTYTDNEKYFTKSRFQPNSDEVYIRLMRDFIGSDHNVVTLERKACQGTV